MALPKISFSSANVPVEKIETLWRDVLTQVKAGGGVTVERKNTVLSSVDSCIFGTTVLNFWTADGYRYNRTAQDCAQNQNTDYDLLFIRSGTADFHQREKTASVRSGDCLFLNLAEPFSITKISLLRFTALHIPCELMKSLIPSPQNMTATLLPKQSPWVAALGATMRALTPKAVELPFFTQNDLFGHICCLLSLAAVPAGSKVEDQKNLMLNRFRQSIHDRFYKAGLSPKNVAEDHKVSIRTLHSVFARAHSSFGHELLALRMDRAAHLLRDPRFNNKTIAEIGVLVGYPHPSHFTTLFIKAHGITPSAFRRREQSKYLKEFVKK